ncbi:unnamed protein product, partial [Effrenium voratum]
LKVCGRRVCSWTPMLPGKGVSFDGRGAEEGERDEKDAAKPVQSRAAARDNFLSAAVLGNMVSLGSDANAGMMAVRHARIIQQLILGSGNEASKAYEKWQRRGKASMVKNSDDLQNDVRKAGNKMRQRRRTNLLSRLNLNPETPKEPEASDREREPGGEPETPESEESSSSSNTSTTSSSDEDEVPGLAPGLGFMRMTGRRQSLSGNDAAPSGALSGLAAVSVIAQRRNGLRQPSLAGLHPSEMMARKRQSQQGHWGQLAGLAHLLAPGGDRSSVGRASISDPNGTGTASPRRSG